MRKRITITILAGLILGLLVAPSFAMSDLAESFLLSCRAVGQPSPLERWDKNDLRTAAVEVLDAIEGGRYDKWPLVFCLNSLGMAQYPIDIPRITAYKDDMIYVVLDSLKGFPHKDAVEFQLKYVTNKEVTIREVAIKGLAEIDFMKLDNARKWHGVILESFEKAKASEKVDWMKKDLDTAIKKVKNAKLPAVKRK
jgi:hypothetical protein